MRWVLIFFSLANSIVVFADSGITLNKPDTVNILERHDVMMGTEVGILILSDNEPAALAAINQGFAEMRRVEDLMTDWRDSKFERINQNAGEQAVEVGDEIVFLLQEAKRVSELTQGAFDISYAAVGKLWNLKEAPFTLPQQDQIKAALALVGYQHIQIEPKAATVYLPFKGMRIGLGGIAKGYAVDRVVKVIKSLGFTDFAVNAGGDLTVKGERGDELWKVSVRHPRNLNSIIAVLPISNGTVVTSGDSERFIEVEGARYSHIIDPRSGYPANSSQSVTIMAKTAYLADALATGVFVLGPNEGMALIESLDHIEGLIVDAQGKVTISSGLSGDSGRRKVL